MQKIDTRIFGKIGLPDILPTRPFTDTTFHRQPFHRHGLSPTRRRFADTAFHRHGVSPTRPFTADTTFRLHVVSSTRPFTDTAFKRLTTIDNISRSHDRRRAAVRRATLCEASLPDGYSNRSPTSGRQ